MLLPQGILAHLYRWRHVSLLTVVVFRPVLFARISLLWFVVNGGPEHAENFDTGESSASVVAVLARRWFVVKLLLVNTPSAAGFGSSHLSITSFEVHNLESRKTITSCRALAT